MLSGEGPSIAPVVDEVPAYANVPVRATVPIGAYGGVPISGEHGDVYGVLEGVDPSPQPAAMIEELPLLQTLGQVLGMAFEGHGVGRKGSRSNESSGPLWQTRSPGWPVVRGGSSSSTLSKRAKQPGTSAVSYLS